MVDVKQSPFLAVEEAANTEFAKYWMLSFQPMFRTSENI
jgi:hypothetical protein